MNQTAQELMIFSKAMLSINDTADLLKFLNSEECAFLQVEKINIILRCGQSDESVLYYVDDQEKVHREAFYHQEYDIYSMPYDDGIYNLDGVSFYYSHPYFTEHPAYENIHHYCKVPLKSTNQQIGFIEFINPQVDELEDGERQFRLQNSMIVSFVTHVLDHELASNMTQQLSNERDNYHILVDVTNAVISQSNKEMLLSSLQQCLFQHFSITDVALIDINQGLYTQNTGRMVDGKVYQQSHFFNDDSVFQAAVNHNEIVYLDHKKLAYLSDQKNTLQFADDITKIIIMPLIFRRMKVGYIAYMMRDDKQMPSMDIDTLQQVAARVALAMHSVNVHEAHSKMMPKGQYESIDESYDNHLIFDDIISQSESMNRVLDQVAMVADCDSTVMILGETGTGKELIARAIHKMSRRSQKRMVKMNCAAVPEGLFESELFGHEKGAFTGAVSSRVGRFEQANNGTLFLDEVGDMPLSLQPKLLRALQENEIERVGRNQLIPVDVRIVVATNANLLEMVEEKTFRSDLYYRMNIFPIIIPPLRERPEDIPLLVKHFTRVISKKMGKNITAVANNSMRALSAFDWPGNVRQLRNFIERSVILTRGDVLNVPVEELVSLGLELDDSDDEKPTVPVAAADMDRDVVIQTLRDCNGIVAGARGAAAKLGLKRTTLLSRMQKMGISSKDYLPEV
ncbi:sigma 54-interacting transcriptional regulator [Vibrio nitrifigilis]|uniref:Sigma 54-interacting transcriptional regulator n=1 Tax=Vibrio nitrifigilis TaxID=2789781 RepID=A0ABS0GG81_9VIBR|nr:sigma 54-interacting transcriptional regulator [Vibrio nitrifigilis]MBF9001439.1 sigma 54-interacting transcriptional regulator [Vibrio nitrifigilis]